MAQAKKKHKHKPLPQGMTYAEKLAQDRMHQEAVERAAVDETVRIRADIQSQRMMTQKNDQQYALDKLRQRAEQVSGVPIEYLYEKEILAAKDRNEAKGVFFPVLEVEAK